MEQDLCFRGSCIPNEKNSSMVHHVYPNPIMDIFSLLYPESKQLKTARKYCESYRGRVKKKKQ